MKVFKKIGIALLAGIMTVIPLTACKTSENDGLDPTKTPLRIGVYNGGFGYDWANELAEKFEQYYANTSFEKGKTGVDVEILPGDKTAYEPETLITRLQMGNETADVYYTAATNHWDFYEEGVVADIDAVMREKVYAADGNLAPEGQEQYSIYDKMNEYFQTSFPEEDGKFYAFPYMDSIVGLVYDHDLLINRSILHEDADGNVTDYPQTYDDFKNMLDRIDRAGMIGLTYSSQDAGFYTTCIQSALVAQYEGLDNAALNLTYGGENGTDYTFPAGTFSADELQELGGTATTEGQTIKITAQNAYLLSRQPGKLAALQFVEMLFSGNRQYLDPKLGNLTQSFSQTQTNFIQSEKLSQESTAENAQQPIAMIVEGEWWENEARQQFIDMGTAFGEALYGYGVRDFRFMPLPFADGSKSDKHVYHSLSSGSTAFVNARSEHKDLAGLWIQFALQESSLEAFTLKTGIVLPYEFDLSAEQQQELTPFAQNVYSIRTDENVVISRHSDMCDFKKYGDGAIVGGFGDNMTFAMSTGNISTDPFNLFLSYSYTSAQLMEGNEKYLTKEMWTGKYNDYMAAIS